MIARLERRLAYPLRIAGAGLFLVLCGHVAYTAGARTRDGVAPALPACGAAGPCRFPCGSTPRG